MSPTVRLLALSTAVFFAGSACDDDDGVTSAACRFDPGGRDCDGGAGAFCRDDRDCYYGLFCCEERSNCGGGMCTAECRSDRDCPYDMRCEHNLCFYACDSDRDCARGQSCEHGNTVCEWP